MAPPIRFFLLCACSLLFGACSLLEKEEDPIQPSVQDIAAHPLPPEKAEALVKDMGKNWLYGDGFGEAAINVGTSIVFPPYLLYLIGNGILSVSGYKPVQMTNVLPAEERDSVNEMYQQIASTPGKVAAAMAGEEYRNQELVKAAMRQHLEELKSKNPPGSSQVPSQKPF